MNENIQGLVAALGIGEAELAEFLQRKLDAKNLMEQAAEIDAEIDALLAKVAELKEKRALIGKRAEAISESANSKFDGKAVSETRPAVPLETAEDKFSTAAREEPSQAPDSGQRIGKTSRPAGAEYRTPFDFLSGSAD